MPPRTPTRSSARRTTSAHPTSLRILTVDIGGSGLKAALLDADGNLLTERARIETPHPCPPDALVNGIVTVVKQLGRNDYRVVSVGFPGVVRRGVILTAPNLGTKELAGFNLAGAVSQRLGQPTRVLNDADLQGLGSIGGHGVEMVITFGTGFGSAIFVDGRLGPHLEISHLPLAKGENYDERLGDAAFKKIGPKKWNRRVARVLEIMRTLTNFDRLYIGGGNAREITLKLPADVQIVPNENGLRGGAWLWRQTSGLTGAAPVLSPDGLAPGRSRRGTPKPDAAGAAVPPAAG